MYLSVLRMDNLTIQIQYVNAVIVERASVIIGADSFIGVVGHGGESRM